MQILTVVCLGLVLSRSLSEAELGVIGDISDETFEMLISGGYKPKSNRLSRHVVSIRTHNYVRHRGDNHFCSGVLVSSRAVLTAAHCLTDRYKASMNPRGIRVVFAHITRLADYEDADTRAVDRLVVHPEYERYKKNDLAVLRLAERIPSSNHDVLPLLLRKMANVTYGDTCVTLGWGQVYQHGPYSDELLYLDVILRPPSLCQKHDGSFTSDHYVCTEPVGEGETCAGDMGGPLLCNGALLGLIGGHQGCAGGKAMKFVSFLYYKDWITTTIKSLSDCGFRVSISSVFLTPFLLILVN
ncbi:chymotrypsin-2 [Drosophila subpulchrella]|uniref:chymotrypsin-2 n=2 Tax=Drosophila subpulchrella TaxID=1486046 RepID=UPI0018A171D5|nr:chymotrypsin-2 [Drosophila subpulchrella]